MRATIEQSEKTTGLLRKTTHYVVTCKVDFNEEEKQIIKKRKLENYDVVTTSYSTLDNQKWAKDRGLTEKTIKIRQFLEGPVVHGFSTPARAKAFEHELNQLLPGVKKFIEENATVQQGVRTVEM